jgi:hypothetical protein
MIHGLRRDALQAATPYGRNTRAIPGEPEARFIWVSGTDCF